MRQAEPSNLTSIIRESALPIEEWLWLLSTLSELRSEEWILVEEPFFIGICLEMLMDNSNILDIVLLDAVVTLAAISCSPERANWVNILSHHRDYPWLLLNIRNTNLIPIMYEGTPSDNHKQLTSLLFLIVFHLLCQRSDDLAVRYFTIITAKGDLPVYASALTAIAPSMMTSCLSIMGKMLMASQM